MKKLRVMTIVWKSYVTDRECSHALEKIERGLENIPECLHDKIESIEIAWEEIEEDGEGYLRGTTTLRKWGG